MNVHHRMKYYLNMTLMVLTLLELFHLTFILFKLIYFRVIKVAKNVADLKVNFAISSKDEFSHELSEYGLTASPTKPVVAAKNTKNEKFVMSEEFRLVHLIYLQVYCGFLFYLCNRRTIFLYR